MARSHVAPARRRAQLGTHGVRGLGLGVIAALDLSFQLVRPTTSFKVVWCFRPDAVVRCQRLTPIAIAFDLFG